MSTLLFGAPALLLGSQAAQKQRWLPAVAQGEALLALAFEERATRYNLAKLTTREKLQVFDAHVADAILVLARNARGHGLYLVERERPGVMIQRQTRIDSRNLRTRKQFGVSIGCFQAFAHRAARLYIELALARSAVAAAASGAEMHGGSGVTDDFHIGLYLKRTRAADVLFGDATYHLRRWVEIAGY